MASTRFRMHRRAVLSLMHMKAFISARPSGVSRKSATNSIDGACASFATGTAGAPSKKKATSTFKIVAM